MPTDNFDKFSRFTSVISDFTVGVIHPLTQNKNKNNRPYKIFLFITPLEIPGTSYKLFPIPCLGII